MPCILCPVSLSGDVLVKVKVKVLVAQLCLPLCDSVDYSPPGSSVHGILKARMLEWAVISSSRGRTQVSCTAGRYFTV